MSYFVPYWISLSLIAGGVCYYSYGSGSNARIGVSDSGSEYFSDDGADFEGGHSISAAQLAAQSLAATARDTLALAVSAQIVE